MRTNKELLQVFLDNQNFFYRGMCWWVHVLLSYDKISLEEAIYIRALIGNNKPLLTKIGLQGSGGFYWKKGDIKPRIKWLKKHLK